MRGTVQGVGFRPFVYGLATRLQLGGFVRNESGTVFIEVEGDEGSVRQFLHQLRYRPPPLAHIESITGWPQPACGGVEFRILQSSVEDSGAVFLSPDVATCPDCLSELTDPSDRRYKYPFLNCTNCGPRLTIIRGAPYDRERTTMAAFGLCPECRQEYENPADRRFHAQPIACPACGPRLEAVSAVDAVLRGKDPLQAFIDVLKGGGVGAVKGLGGYHLACDARNNEAVCELRRRKHRDDKPFAIMVGDVDAARRLCEISPHEQELLESPRRPIVLLKRRSAVSSDLHANQSRQYEVCEAVAPRNPYLGVMLPYTPLHHLIFGAIGNVPLVMTSGNRSDEPIAYLDDDAQRRLGDIADMLLRHNRPIHVRCDDSITRSIDGVELPIRRSRGYAPQPTKLPIDCGIPILAVGGQLKGTFALGIGGHAIISHHLGDLDQFEAFRQFEHDIKLYQRLSRITPELIVHDSHPDYASTGYARQRAAADRQPIFAVQHHHAHMASCMAENGLNEPVIGVTFDGTGFGVDETTNKPVIWGGEFLVGDYHGFRRAAHLRYVPMPGGDKAAREPWRMAAAYLDDAGARISIPTGRVPAAARRTVENMLARRFNCPLTSSAGRLFDAVASIAGVRDYVNFEGQAAMELEWLAGNVAPNGAYPFDLSWPVDSSKPGVIDTRPLILSAAEDAYGGVGAANIARRFHSTLVAIIADVCGRISERTGLDAVVLSGGVFLNAVLTKEVQQCLARMGLRVYRHRLVPPNDGGLSLGQLAVAAASVAARPRRSTGPGAWNRPPNRNQNCNPPRSDKVY